MSPERPVVGDTAHTGLLSWSADGKWISIGTSTGLPGSIEKLDPFSGARERVRERVPSDMATAVQAANESISPDGRFHAYPLLRTSVSDLWMVDGAG